MDYWHITNKKLFDSFKKDIDTSYPTLLVSVIDNLVHIKGTIRIRDSKNVILDSFRVDIKVPHNFPKEIPELQEVGNRVPKVPDRHFNELNGYACLAFRDEVFIYWNENSTIIDFINVFVEPFFLWQIEYEATDGKNKNKAYSHGIVGAIEFYKKILKTDDINLIHKFIEFLTKKEIRGHSDCFCGSGKKIRNCHLELIKQYKQKIRIEYARSTLAGLEKHLLQLQQNEI